MRAWSAPAGTATSSPAPRAAARRAAIGRQQLREPSGALLDVVVGEEQPVGVGRLDRRVARGVEAERALVGDIAGTGPLGRGPGLAVRPVVDDHDLDALAARLFADRRERVREIPRPPTGGNDD